MPGGRPTKLTPEMEKQLATYLAAGVPRTHAAEAVGIHRETLRSWTARGEEWLDAPLEEVPESEQPYARFAAMIRQETARGAARFASLLAQLAMDPSVPEVVRLRATIYWLTHSDRANWHPQGQAASAAEDVEVVLAWDD